MYVTVTFMLWVTVNIDFKLNYAGITTMLFTTNEDANIIFKLSQLILSLSVMPVLRIFQKKTRTNNSPNKSWCKGLLTRY